MELRQTTTTRLMVFVASLFSILLSGFASTLAIAEERIALIVGNGAYTSVATLDNPVSDAGLMAKTLENLGFRVTLLSNSDQRTLTAGIARFGRDLRDAGDQATGLFYYAGHGVQSFGTNYLLPTDVSLTDAADLDLVAVPAESVLRQMRSARNKTNIVILDACRNNPFESILDMNDNGLAEMNAPTGTFLAYSTSPGAVALDGTEGNSAFTRALARKIKVPGTHIEQLFKQVRVEVLKSTKGRQIPWDSSSLTGDFYFSAPPEMTAEELAEEKQLWTSIRDARNSIQIVLFLRAYPKGKYLLDARGLLAEVGLEKSAPVKPTIQIAEADPEPIANPDEQLFDVARNSGSSIDYNSYLEKFPNGKYVDVAKLELLIIEKKNKPVQPEDQIASLPKAIAETIPQEVTYHSLFTIGKEDVKGKSLEQLAAAAPRFPPIEGLPDAVWKGKKCTNCHIWTKAALCTQGTTYLAQQQSRALAKLHPYGGIFKQHLRKWAEGDCK